MGVRRRVSFPLTPVAPLLFCFLLLGLSSPSFYMFPFLRLCSSATVRCRSGVSDPDLRRSEMEERMCGFFGQAEWRWFRSGVRSGFVESFVSFLCLLCLIFSIWMGWFAWLKTLRVPQTVELRCFFRCLVGPRWRSFLGRSTILTWASMVLLSFPSRLDLLRVLRCRGVCEEASSRSCQPRLAFSMAARVESTRTEG